MPLTTEHRSLRMRLNEDQRILLDGSSILSEACKAIVKKSFARAATWGTSDQHAYAHISTSLRTYDVTHLKLPPNIVEPFASDMHLGESSHQLSSAVLRGLGPRHMVPNHLIELITVPAWL